MEQLIKKNYKTINIIILSLCIYIFCLPITSQLIEKVFPRLTQCPFLLITGKPCPLCGGTRYIQNLPNVFKDITYIFNFFGVCIIIFLIEIIFRIINLFKNNFSDKYINIDLLIHIILIIGFILYEIIYIVFI